MSRESDKPRVVDALKKAGAKGLTRQELMDKLGISYRSASRHLSALSEADRIEQNNLRDGKASRPEIVYYIKGAR